MKILVRFFSSLSKITKTSEMEISLPNDANLKDLLCELSKRFGLTFNEALYESDLGSIDPYTSVIIDGKPVILSEHNDLYKLKENTVVVFLSPTGGG
jgi:molybdopterin converting factor small subunit